MEITETTVKTALKKIGFIVEALGPDHDHETDINYLIDFVVESGRCHRHVGRRRSNKREKRKRSRERKNNERNANAQR